MPLMFPWSLYRVAVAALSGWAWSGWPMYGWDDQPQTRLHLECCKKCCG